MIWGKIVDLALFPTFTSCKHPVARPCFYSEAQRYTHAKPARPRGHSYILPGNGKINAGCTRIRNYIKHGITFHISKHNPLQLHYPVVVLRRLQYCVNETMLPIVYYLIYFQHIS